MLVGASNAFTTDLRNLETNRFETASIYGKRLVVVTDAGRYGGAVDTLKALVGQDPMRIERKNVQQSGSFIFTGIVLFASNEQLISTDLTSGLDRRRAVVQFNRVVPEIEKAAWAKRGGEEAVLHKEIPGLVNWLLSIHKDEVTRIIASPPAQAADSNREAMLANNHVARWLAECCIPEKGVCTIVGQKKEVVENGQREIAFSSEHLYPNFIAFTIGEGVQPLGRGRFKETLIDASRTMGHPLENKRKPHSGVDSFFGIRLKSQSEPLYPWHRPIATAPSNDYAEVEI
jgi:putative DNA primase/helicase